MASSALANASIASNVPAVAHWTLLNGQEKCLGAESGSNPCSAAVDIHLDETRHTFSCKLRIPVRIKSHGNKVYMYFLIGPQQISNLEPWSGHVPQNVVNTFVAGDHCSSSDDILGFDFSLASPGLVVGPRAVIEPKTTATRKVLEALISLGQTDRIAIFVPCATVHMRRLLQLPKGFLGASSTLNVRIIDTLYAGKGGRAIHSVNELSEIPTFTNTSAQDPYDQLERPPAYDQITGALAQTLPPKRPKGMSSSDGEESPLRKKGRQASEQSVVTTKAPLSTSIDVIEPWERAFAEQATQLAVLAKQVSDMRDEIYPRHFRTADAAVQTVAIESGIQSGSQTSPSTCSTVEDGLDDRLLLAECNVATLRGEMVHLQEWIKVKLAQSVDSAVQVLTEKLDDRLASRLKDLDSLDEQTEELRSEISSEMHELLEDMVTGVKSELHDFIEEEMVDMEGNVMDKIKSALSQATLNIDFLE